MAVHEVVHAVADATGRSDEEIEALVAVAVVTAGVIAVLRAIDTLSQAMPPHPRKATRARPGVPRLTTGFTV